MNEGQGYWLRSGFLTLTERLAALILNLLTATFLLRLLSKEDFATWSFFILLTYFMEIGRIGLLQNGLVRFLSINKGNPSEYADISTSALILNVLYTVVAVILMYLATPWIIETWQFPRLDKMLPIYFLANIFLIWLFHFNFVQQANLEFRGIFWSTLCFRGGKFVLVMYSLATGFSIELQHLAMAKLAGTAAGAFVSWRFAAPHLKHTLSLNFSWLRKLVQYGKFVLGTNLNAMLQKSADKLAVGQLLGPAAYAIYDVAARVSHMVDAPSFSIAAVVFPQSARRMEESGRDSVSDLYERSVAVTLAIILPIMLLAFVFAGPIVILFAGSSYADSVGVLQIIVLTGVFLPYAVQFGTTMDATGQPGINYALTLTFVLVSLSLNYVLIPILGLLGGALAMMLSSSINFMLTQTILYKRFGIRWWKPILHLPYFYTFGLSLIRNNIAQKKSRSVR
jgi:O-antigen/teichoic acid export membrane protein